MLRRETSRQKKLVSPQQDDGMLCLALLWSADVCRQSSTNCPRLKLLFLQAPCPAGFSYLFKGPRRNLLVDGCQQGRGRWEQEPPLILNCVPCPFCSNFMKILSKNWNKKGFFKPFLLIYSLLPLSHLQISQPVSYHLCLIFFLPSGLLFVRRSQPVWTWFRCLLTQNWPPNPEPKSPLTTQS